MRADGIPFGMTLLAPGGDDALLASASAACSTPTPACRWARGRTGRSRALAPRQPQPAAGEIAHRGGRRASVRHGAQLASCGAPRTLSLRGADDDAPDYKLYALNGTTPPKPGLLRVAAG